MKTQKAYRYPIQKTETEWKAILSAEAYQILRQKGTESPGSGQYNHFFEKGIYRCKACGKTLFNSENKFDTHSRWPSFNKESEEGRMLKQTDHSRGMQRTEILCADCGSHLGHIFDDERTETGLRYCVNSLALDFEQDKEKSNIK